MFNIPTVSAAIKRAQEWSELDPNEATKSYVEKLVERAQEEVALGDKHDALSSDAATEICKLFPKDRIKFGTAGLRASMNPGPVGMNDLVVVQTAQGLAKYVLKSNEEMLQKNPGKKLCAIIGYDHRKNPKFQISSLRFAILSALVFSEAGMDFILLEGYVATPFVPYVLTNVEDAVVGVMVTASHNPKNDDGYKVYWSNACQIRSPVDRGIATSILNDGLKPWVDYGKMIQERELEYLDEPCLGLSNPKVTKEMINSYFCSFADHGLVTGQKSLLDDNNWKPPSFAYTAMHGIGFKFAVRSFEAFGLPAFHAVPSQKEPDATFPTVPFPNPEEKGALDKAKSFAEENDCDVVLANDPDADRLAVAEKDRVSGEWTVFTGDQIGTMLGHWLYEQVGKKANKPVSMCASTVSSKMLKEIARKEGFRFEETLTGFKWIGSRSAELQNEGYLPLFSYEEAIGFCCGNLIFDKDGVSAAAVFAELSLFVYHQGLNLVKHLQSLYDKYGEFVSNNGYYFMRDNSVVPAIMDNMTCQGRFDLVAVGPYEVESIRFLGDPPYDSTVPNKKPKLESSKHAPMLTINFKNGCVAHFRASGTEPKFKYYIEMKGKVGVARGVVEQDLLSMSATIIEELVKPKQNGLYLPTDSQ